jgi:hypothetical protein
MRRPSERVDDIHICVSADPDVAAVDPPYAVLASSKRDAVRTI